MFVHIVPTLFFISCSICFWYFSKFFISWVFLVYSSSICLNLFSKIKYFSYSCCKFSYFWVIPWILASSSFLVFSICFNSLFLISNSFLTCSVHFIFWFIVSFWFFNCSICLIIFSKFCLNCLYFSFLLSKVSIFFLFSSKTLFISKSIFCILSISSSNSSSQKIFSFK